MRNHVEGVVFVFVFVCLSSGIWALLATCHSRQAGVIVVNVVNKVQPFFLQQALHGLFLVKAFWNLSADYSRILQV